MSYLADLIHKRITVQQALAKSVVYLKRKAGAAITDDQVDVAVADAQQAASAVAQTVQKQLSAYIAAHLPLLPADIIAAAATTAALNAIDVAIAGAGNVVKDHN